MGTAAKRTFFVLGLTPVMALLIADAALITRWPCLGVADIFDFWRVMSPAGIEHVEPLDRPGLFVRCSFATRPTDMAWTQSSSAFLAFLARNVSWGLRPGPELMDVRQMGLLFLALLALMAVLAIRAGVPALLVATIVYVISDPGYLLFFNSFYADPALFVAVAGLVLWLAARGNLPGSFWAQPVRPWLAQSAALVLLIALGSFSKMQYALLPSVVLAVLLPPMFAAFKSRKGRATLLAGVLTALCVGAPWLFLVGPGPRFLDVNNYHAVYGGILKLSSDPERVLRRLEVPETFWGLPRKDVFSAGIPVDHPVHAHLTPLSRTALLWLYATDPTAVNGARSNVEKVLAIERTHPRGNFVRSPETPRIAFYKTRWQFARLRGFLFGSTYLAAWALCGLACLWLAVRLASGRWGPLESTTLFLLAWFSSQIVITILGDGLVSLHQHMIGARLALDLLLVVLAFMLGREALQAAKARFSAG